MARITVETNTVMVIRNARTERAWCPGCRADVDAVTLDGASLSETCASGRIQEWVNTGRLHLWQRREGPVQICLTSLLHCLEPDEVPKFRIAKEKT